MHSAYRMLFLLLNIRLIHTFIAVIGWAKSMSEFLLRRSKPKIYKARQTI